MKEKGKVLVSKRKEKEEGLDTKAEKKRNRLGCKERKR